MTKEELAKKRGVKISKDMPTPSEALLTTKPDTKSPAKKVSPRTKSVPVVPEKKTVIKEPVPEIPAAQPVSVQALQSTATPAVADHPAKNKGGRPKTRTEEVKIANIAIPLSVYNDMTEHALALYNNNLTGYVNSLIKKDLDANLDNYKKVSAFLKQAKGI